MCTHIKAIRIYSLTDGVDMVGQPRHYEVGGDDEQDLFDWEDSSFSHTWYLRERPTMQMCCGIPYFFISDLEEVS